MTEPDARKSRTACIFCNGELRTPDRAKELAAGADMLIAADGGAARVRALGLKPAAIIGDMDSLSSNPWPDDKTIDTVTFPREKNKCDGEIAVQWAFEQGCIKVLLLAAWGGRLDQSLGNCALLLQYPGQLAVWDDGILAHALPAGREVILPVDCGTCVSLIPFSAETRIHTSGLKYTLKDESLQSATHGMGNIATAANPTVYVSNGLIIVCMEGGESWLNT